MPASVERLFAGTGFAHGQWIPRAVDVPADATALIVVINGDRDLDGRNTVEYRLGGESFSQVWVDDGSNGSSTGAVFVLQGPATGEQTLSHAEPSETAGWGNVVLYAVRGGNLIETVFGPTFTAVGTSGAQPPVTVEGLSEGDLALFVQMAWGDNNTDYTFDVPSGGTIAFKGKGFTSSFDNEPPSPPWDEWDAVSIFEGNPLGKVRAQAVGFAEASEAGDITGRFQGVDGFTIDWLVGFRIEAVAGDPDPHDITGSITAPGPRLSGAAEHTPPQIDVGGAMAAPAPGVGGGIALELPEHTASGGAGAPAPRVSGAVAQELPTHEATGGLRAPTPGVGGALAVELPEHTASGSATAPAPQLQGEAAIELPTHEAGGGLTAPSPTLSGQLAHEPPGQTIGGGISAPGPRLSGQATHVAPVLEAGGGLVAPAPRLAGALDHDTGEPRVSGGLRAPAPRLAGSVSLELPEHTAQGGLTVPAPLVVGLLEHEDMAARLLGGLVAPAPGLAGAASLEFPEHAASGGMTVGAPRLSGPVIQGDGDPLRVPSVILQAPDRVSLRQAPDRISMR